jgi:hypothetical protein
MQSLTGKAKLSGSRQPTPPLLDPYGTRQEAQIRQTAVAKNSLNYLLSF